MQPIFIAGPCVIESEELLDTVAQRLVDINQKLGTDIIFKASFDKANRTSIHSFRGPGPVSYTHLTLPTIRLV